MNNLGPSIKEGQRVKIHNFRGRPSKNIKKGNLNDDLLDLLDSQEDKKIKRKKTKKIKKKKLKAKKSKKGTF